MKPSELVWNWVQTFVAILAMNVVIRVATRGFDAILDFSWLGVGIAAIIASVVTRGMADRG